MLCVLGARYILVKETFIHPRPLGADILGETNKDL